ncbi:MAG: phosphoribosylamine--glycine ligase, partial [Desulfobulbaceae bacterium]|nr:phosphoribosylamine--glycine ligase [Desulfobulbaceae bacterium]
MKILVLGSGGREHALVWKLLQSPKVDDIYCAPGNAGIGEIATCINIAADDVEGLLDFAEQEGIDLTVVGPEGSLTKGIVDRFEERGLRIFGPSGKGAVLEGSKVFTKDLMAKYNIPTGSYKVFTDRDEAVKYIKEIGASVVVKADGLAAGKG